MCHCDDCKRRTGSAFSLSMITWRKDFEVLSGETLTSDNSGGSGAIHRQHVCPKWQDVGRVFLEAWEVGRQDFGMPYR